MTRATHGCGEPGQQRRDTGGVGVVRRAERAPEVTLLEPDPDSDVGGRGESEEQVRGAHVGGRPEGQKQSGHQRVSHNGVEASDLQLGGRADSRGRPAGLPQPGELEVVDRKGRRDRQEPAGGAERPQDERGRAVDVPDLAAAGLPQQPAAGRGRCRWRGRTSSARATPGPATQPPLDAATSHHRVLHGEQQQERQVGGDGHRRGRARRSVHDAGDDDPARKAIVHSVMATKPNQATTTGRDTGWRDTLPCSGGRPPRRSRGTTSLAWPHLLGLTSARARRTRRLPGSAT